jgi:membrane protease subunit (stomatin/prohibitin family)
MTFFNKVEAFAKNAADKAGETIEITKINAKIRTEENKILDLKVKIGDYYYAQYKSGQTLDAAVGDYLSAIDESAGAIASFDAEIQALKSGKAPEAAPAQAAQAEPGTKCPACGAKLDAQAKFCPECGEKRA